MHETQPDIVGLPGFGYGVVVHSSKQRLPNVRAVMGWLERALGDAE